MTRRSSEAGAGKLDGRPLQTFDPPGGRSREKEQKSEPVEVRRQDRRWPERLANEPAAALMKEAAESRGGGRSSGGLSAAERPPPLGAESQVNAAPLPPRCSAGGVGSRSRVNELAIQGKLTGHDRAGRRRRTTTERESD